MTLEETEQGRMSLWDTVIKHALATGKELEEAIRWANRSVEAFETKFHKVESDGVGH